MLTNFLDFYQNLPNRVNPSIISFYGFELRWYSLGYIFSFLLFWALISYRIKKNEAAFKITLKDIEDSMFYLFLGVILGGRLGYVIFYDFSYYIKNPISVIFPFSFENGFKFTGISGMSYHGGVLGVIVSILLFCKKKQKFFFDVMDFYLPCIPIGYFFGRLGNFMNGELYGRITESPWGMYFYTQYIIDDQKIKKVFTELRHPSQLYEAFFEGLVLFFFLWLIRNNKKLRKSFISAFYLIGYGSFRFFIEFYREPDKQFVNHGQEIGTAFWFLTMGQILCFFMVFIGLFLIFFRLKKAKTI